MKMFTLLSCVSVAVADIAGTIKVTYDKDRTIVSFKGDVTGLPKSLAKAGIHVHEGTECTDRAKIKGHLMSKYIDGWAFPKQITYDTDASGKASVDVKAKSFAFENSKDEVSTPNLLNRCVVLHGAASDKMGDRVGIAKIVKDGDGYSATLKKYPGPNALGTTPAGKLAVTVKGDEVHLKGDLTGLGKSLKNAGIHVHTGTDCTGGSDKSTKAAVNTVIGGHLYSKGDAFIETVYTTDDKGKAAIAFSTVANSHILLNKDQEANKNKPAVQDHCIVLHDDAGARIGVAKIVCDKDGKCEAKAGKYPEEKKEEKKDTLKSSGATTFLGMATLVISTVIGFF